MLIVNRIIGRADAPRFAGRQTDPVSISAADAGRRRMRVHSESGAEIGIDLPRQSWLFDGAVLHDDGERVLVVVRRPEPVMVIVLANMTAEAAFRVGHALGNRHSPSEWHGNEIVVPVTDTPELTARPVLALGLPGLVLRVEERPFAADAPPACAGAAHEHHHRDHQHHGHGHHHHHHHGDHAHEHHG
jgi:urease accessory protein